MADKQQAPSDVLIALYDYWAKQGMGVLVTGNVMVDGRYLGEPGNVVLDSDDPLNQFLSPADNHRTDLYGGSLDNRLRFLLEIYQGLREQVGPDFTIALKLNASDFKEEGFCFEDCKYVVKRMSELGIDLIEISGGNYETPVFGGEYESGAGFVTYAVALADLTSVPIVSTGGFRKVTQMEEAIEEGVSMIGLARPFVLRPSLVNDYREDRDFQLSTPRLTTGLSKLDQALGPIIGVSYYEAQMKRLAKGRSVKISQNAWPYLLQTVKVHGLSALKPRRK